jgi:osmotically inducible protein OsmC
MAKILYTAEANVTGGRDEGHGKSTDGELEVDLRLPEAMGGEGGGTNPEQLFAVGYAACFEGAIKVVGKRLKTKVEDVSIDSKVHLLPTPERGFKLAVELDVELPSVKDREMAQEVVRNAHAVCPYSNATRGNIDVTLRLEGREIGGTSEENPAEASSSSGGSDDATENKTKEELLQEAKKLDVEGRSKMTKDELADAIADAK